MDSVTAARALLLTQEEATEGNALISLETQEDLTKDNLCYAVAENLPAFLEALRYLNKEDQEMLLSYYMLHKSQTCLALVHRTTQTLCSFQIRVAIKRLGFHLVYGKPKVADLAPILRKARWEKFFKQAPMSEIVISYAELHSFPKVGARYNIERTKLRKALRGIAADLLKSENEQELMLGAFIHGLVDKKSPVGAGVSKRKGKKLGHCYLVDPDALGRFRVDVTDPGFKDLFVSSANLI